MNEIAKKHQSPWDQHCNDQDLLAFQYSDHSLNSPTRQWFVDEVRSWDGRQNLLDAGCGAGATFYTLQQTGLLGQHNCVGVDGSEKQIALAKKKIQGARFYTVDLRFLLPLCFYEDQPGLFNRILLRAVLEHTDDPESILRGFLYLLNKTGTLYIVWWNNPVYSEPLRLRDRVGRP
jgi:2-polyprenyl-3-methyl-5-hydroxy-6-metoxy-1,4-benzoquinol methylase